ncbi:U-box domain-containing protein 9-like [Salvia splendens]|uniref:U-box domain-containing protein 9-like n=1 Tax=Salvia splendens TaxID=180675 RepID=UPI001C255E4A|nr:U-box domain-containing protein 9-like [Salvia splendens]XP_042066411.1 U-box domain-containing protein 9-like [Salvia splendens]
MALSGVKEADAADLKLHDTIPGGVVVPEEFTCPISKKIMKDPVIVPSTGVTYDRDSIQKWIEDGNATCPQTGKRIQSLAMLIQDNVRKDMISSWFENPSLNNEFQQADFQATMEINLTAETLEGQRELFERLRRLTKENHAFRKHFVESAAVHVPTLFNGLCLAIAASRKGIFLDDLRESLIATLTNIAIRSDNIKRLVANKPHRIGIIAEAMDVRGDIRFRTVAASAIKTLSTLDLFKEKVLEAHMGLSGSLLGGVMVYLKGMLEVCDVLAVEEAVGAIIILCSVPGNMKHALNCGTIGVIMDNIKYKVFPGYMLQVLAMFSTDKIVIEEIVR